MTKFEKLLEVVAKEHNTTPDEVEREIKAAINAAGLDLTPQAFIALCTARVKAQIEQEKPN